MLSEWTPRLTERFGSPKRLAGIQIFHDFRWTEVFGHERGQFRNGQYLAELVKEKCPPHLRPALLLTIRDDVQESGFEDDRGFYVVVVRIRQYLQMASGNAATTYFAMQLPTNIISAQSLDWSRLTSQQIQGLLDEHLDVNQLSNWLNTRPNRVQLLTALFAENSNSDVLETLLAEHAELPTLLVRLVERRPDAARALAEIIAVNDEALSAVRPLLVARPELWRLAEARDNLVPMLLPEQRSTLLTSLANELGDSLWTTLESAGINLPRARAWRRCISTPRLR